MMRGDEVLAIRLRLGLSQLAMAERMGVDERTVRRWEDRGCPELVARFLTTMIEED